MYKFILFIFGREIYNIARLRMKETESYIVLTFKRFFLF